MRSFSPLGPAMFVALALAATGCAHTIESSSHERTVVAVDTPSTTVITEAPPPAVVEPPATRPRLSQVVTLGQGGQEGTYGPTGAAAGPPAGPNGTNVIVNNNVTIVNGQPVYGYGTYGGYGYGGYGGVARQGTTSQRAWAPNGWEGARRTASPGTTPNVGGNWPTPPSHGPSQLK